MASTLKLTDIQHPSSGTPAITIGSDNAVAIGGGNISPQTGFRNRIINGAMTIDQRNAGASVTITAASAAEYVLDRFYCRAESSTGSKISVQRSTVAPSGFINSTLLTSLSAYTLGASEHFSITQPIEGFNAADLSWGTAAAQPITVSFWVRSSLTGTFGGGIVNQDANRCFIYSYTITAANTWEYKTITIPGDTTGTWLTNNGVGLYLNINVAAGSSVTAAAGSWSSTFSRSVTGQTSLVGTSGATFYITGVQLEKGSVATPFEFRSIGTENALCQRYYEFGSTFQMFSGNVTSGEVYYNPVRFSVTKRAAPTVVAGATNGVTLFVVRFPTTPLTASLIASDGYYAQAVANGSGTGYYQYSWTASAEL